MDKEVAVHRKLLRLGFTLALIAAAAAVHAAGPPQRIIVKYHSTLDAQASNRVAAQSFSAIAARFGVGMTTQRTSAGGARIVRLDRELPREDLDTLIQELAADPSVAYAEEDVLVHHTAMPNDPLLPQQWDFIDPKVSINAPAAWQLSTGKGITVAVVDTGYRPHADLVANIIGGYDFISDAFMGNDGDERDADATDPGDFTEPGDCGPPEPSSWHGTHVAGTIAARTNNGIGVTGIAHNARVLPVRALGRCGGFTSDVADAIIWASGGEVPGVPANPHPARVINLSLGSGSRCPLTTQHAITSARSRGAVVVVSGGNSNALAALSSPASCVGVITVAATNLKGGRAWYSNFGGGFIDVSAPGGDTRTDSVEGVLSLLNDGATTPGNDSYGYYQGTSMAAPHVSGVAALVLAVNPALTPDQVEKIIAFTARPFAARCSQCGGGIVDAAAAVAAARRR